MVCIDMAQSYWLGGLSSELEINNFELFKEDKY